MEALLIPLLLIIYVLSVATNSDTYHDVFFSSNVDNVTITVDGKSCNTPCSLAVSEDGARVKATKENFHSIDGSIAGSGGRKGLITVSANTSTNTNDNAAGSIRGYNSAYFVDMSEIGKIYSISELSGYIYVMYDELVRDGERGGGDAIKTLEVFTGLESDKLVILIRGSTNPTDLNVIVHNDSIERYVWSNFAKMKKYVSSNYGHSDLPFYGITKNDNDFKLLIKLSNKSRSEILYMTVQSDNESELIKQLLPFGIEQ